jgi:hypothetical protein
MSASMSVACLFVIAGKAETLAMLVKASAAVVEKRMVMGIEGEVARRLDT